MRRFSARVSLVASATVALLHISCSGPVPLARASWARHDQEFRDALAAQPASPKEAWYGLMSHRRGVTVEQARASDQALSTTHNPFNARREPAAVSRGAVLYRAYCQRCHGEDARGNGADCLSDHAPRNLHAFAQRFAVTLHGGAPRTWFRKINEGFGDQVTYADSSSSAMPAFGDTLAREQIWLVITYLQSLDVYHQPDPDAVAGKRSTTQPQG